jgi:hypothetical protein
MACCVCGCILSSVCEIARLLLCVRACCGLNVSSLGSIGSAIRGLWICTSAFMA